MMGEENFVYLQDDESVPEGMIVVTAWTAEGEATVYDGPIEMLPAFEKLNTKSGGVITCRVGLALFQHLSPLGGPVGLQ